MGEIDQVLYDENDWASAPTSVGFGGREVILDCSSGRPTHAVSMVGARFGRLVLLVPVPPFTNPNRAYTTVMAAADPDNGSTAEQLLGIDAHGAEDHRLALLAHQRWESEGGAPDPLGRPPGAPPRRQVPMSRYAVLSEYEREALRGIERRLRWERTDLARQFNGDDSPDGHTHSVSGPCRRGHDPGALIDSSKKRPGPAGDNRRPIPGLKWSKRCSSCTH